MYKLFKTIFLMFFAGILLATCMQIKTPLPPVSDGGNPYAPQPGDGALVRDGVQIVKVELASLESAPVQIEAQIYYFTPTTCHQIRLVVHQPGADNRINIEAYSLMKKNQVCNMMALATPSVVNLNLGSFPAGHYTVLVNGVVVGEFDA